MKYLKKLDTFRETEYNKLQPLNEAFSNDITWGGSLLGRFINSSIRWVTIRYKATRIDGLVEEFRSELDKCLVHYTSDDEKEQIRRLRMLFVLNQIYQVVTSQAALVQRLILLLSQNQIRTAGPGIVTTSFSTNAYSAYKKLFEYKDDREDEMEDIGLIQMAINDAKSVNIEDKAGMIDKLESFRDDLLEIKYPEISEKELRELDTDDLIGPSTEEPSQKEDTQKTFGFNSGVKSFLESYLKLHEQIKFNAVKQSNLQKDSIVMWIQQSGQDKGKFSFAKIVDDPKASSDLIVVQKFKKEPSKNELKMVGQSFRLNKNKVKSLTFFDESKFRKMREVSEKDIRSKIENAKVGYYSYYQSKNQAKMSEYEKIIQELSNKLKDLSNQGSANVSTKPTPVPTSGDIKKEMNYYQSFLQGEGGEYHLIVEAETVLKDDKQAQSWNDMIDKFSSAKNEVGDSYKKHLDYLLELLRGRVDGKEDGKLAKKYLRRLGKSIMVETKNKYPKLWGNTPVQPQTNDKEVEGIDMDKLKRLATIVTKFLSIFLPVLDNQELVDSMKQEKKNNTLEVIQNLSNSYKKMIELYKSGLNQVKEDRNHLMTSYKSFRLIKEQEEQDDDIDDEDVELEETGKDDETEAQEKRNDVKEGDEDPILAAWKKYFKPGEEKKWKVQESQIKDFKTKIETDGVTIKLPSAKNESLSLITEADDTVTIPNPERDPIVRIIEIFGRAYKLYATLYIPSGRPGGRVSQRTLREYEYIGSGERDSDRTGAGGEGTDYYTPGKGPWAALHVFEKWRKGVTSIIEKREYRRILANIRYVGSAELDTDTEQIKSGADRSSGVTLLRFINKMINLQGTFREAASEIYKKYFNADIPSDVKLDDGRTGRGGSGDPNKQCSEDDKKPYFIEADGLGSVLGTDLKEGGVYLMKVKFKYPSAVPTINDTSATDRNNWWLVWVDKVDRNGKVTMRVQVSDIGRTKNESILTPHYTAPNAMDLLRNANVPNLPNLNNDTRTDVYLYVLEGANLNRMRVNAGSFNMHRIKLNQPNATNNTQSLTTHVATPGNWQECRDVTISDIFMMVTNCNGTNQQNNHPVTLRWTTARKSANDVEINNNVIQAIRTT